VPASAFIWLLQVGGRGPRSDRLVVRLSWRRRLFLDLPLRSCRAAPPSVIWSAGSGPLPAAGRAHQMVRRSKRLTDVARAAHALPVKPDWRP